MRQSKLFTKVLKEKPRDEESLNAELLLRGGFAYKNSAGVFTYLPLGWRVIQKISNIIREEMNAIGGEELLMPALVEKKYLDVSGRWDVPVGFEAKVKNETKASFVLGWTHEEDFHKYYDMAAEAYHRVFKRCGLKTYYTRAAGGDFTANYTHEFQVLSSVGEDTIFVCLTCGHAENKEISKLKNGDNCPKCGEKVREEKAIEVGNIFPLGTKYSKSFNLQFLDAEGKRRDVIMGSYGIGVSRLMGTIVEVSHDKYGIIWPETLAPFKVHLIALLGKEDDETLALSEKSYAELQKNGVEVLYDDRNDMSAGEKFAEADLI